MNLFSMLLPHRARRALTSKKVTSSEKDFYRHCTFEKMEPRQMLSANPITLGTIYIEEDLGSDLHADRFEVTYSGGAADTELTRLVINGDQNTAGFTVGDVFFDTEETGLGADHSAGFAVEQLISDNPAASVQAYVEDGSSQLILEFQNFGPGDKLIFSIDVDEVEYFDPEETDLDTINDGFDPITSGVEFQGSQLAAYFSAPHYQDTEASTIFWNRYDDELNASGLDLPEDNADGKRDRTTGAFLDVQQEVDPAALSGFVYADDDNDGIRDSGEQGLAGVTVRVIPVDTLAPQQIVTVTTDANGYYEAVDLSPGAYRVVETTQPAGYLDGLDTAGTVSGEQRGSAVNPGDNIENIFLDGGTQGIEYNFGEIRPASLAGSVFLSECCGDCFGSGADTEPLAGVTVQLLNESGQLVTETVTNPQGNYEFVDLAPGGYSVIEITPAGLIDAGAAAGHVDRTTRGRVVDANTIVDIDLQPGDEAVEYEFCEHLPANISGYVYHDRNDNGLRETGEEAISDARVAIFDHEGKQVAVTETDTNGYYEFVGLSAGSYSVSEYQPDGWLDGHDTPGDVDGETSGRVSENDTITAIELQWGSAGVEYNFGELLPGSIQGIVHADTDRDCYYDPTEAPIGNVKIELLDANGVVIATTHTNGEGEYEFQGLAPDVYAVRETQPSGYFQGSQSAGSHGGDDSVDDLISNIPVGSDQHLVHYDFCEIVPGSISGIVYVDPNQNEIFDAGETTISDVTVQLLDADGDLLATAHTNGDGYYEFLDLEPGQYAVRELQPTGYFHGGQQAGSHGGDDSLDDLISRIPVDADQHLVHYNFSEITPGSISGIVYVDPNQNEIFDAGETTISDVTVQLLDADGDVLATAHTNEAGYYEFRNLEPGHYAVQEAQPADYFHGGQQAGSHGGNDSSDDLLAAITVGSGEHLVQYNFSEVPPATISGYVFQDGSTIQTPDGVLTDKLSTIRDGLRTPDDRPIAGVTLELRHGLNGQAILGQQTLSGANPDEPLTAVTDANGYYEFRGLPPGSYAVYQLHPEQYHDGIDTAGSTNGVPFNISHVSPGPFLFLLDQLSSRLAKSPRDDAIVQIPVRPGQTSVENNFSEVLVTRRLVPPIPPRPSPPDIEPRELVVPPPVPLPPSILDLPRPNPDFDFVGGSSELRMTWHLSVVNGGMPRGSRPDANSVKDVWRTASYLNQNQWVSVAMDKGQWTLPKDTFKVMKAAPDTIVFGLPGGIPISGDFNGDGLSEIGVYHQGQWFIDVNGNGQWDAEDLWARLGTLEDLPVVGDWDGDGKDDIGIFGPEWSGDPHAIWAKPGLPDQQNQQRPTTRDTGTAPKNLPPEVEDATDGHRVLKHTAAGTPRVDVIDHVFRFGFAKDLPVAGDWNGDGIRSIGIFRGGDWYLDVNGDGRHTVEDAIATFGENGDLPVVGDFNGDGIDQIGVYRQGTWILDSNGNRKIDAHDEVFRMGDADSKPVVGDWDGDGTDDPALYRDAG